MITLYGLMKFWSGLGVAAVPDPDCVEGITTLISDAPTQETTSITDSLGQTTSITDSLGFVTLIQDGETEATTLIADSFGLTTELCRA